MRGFFLEHCIARLSLSFPHVSSSRRPLCRTSITIGIQLPPSRRVSDRDGPIRSYSCLYLMASDRSSPDSSTKNDKTTIVYESSDVCLIDLPASLQDAQASLVRVLSCMPLEVPYRSTEPTGNKLIQVRKRVDPKQLESDHHLESTIAFALAEVASHINSTACGTPWCCSRFLRPPDVQKDETRCTHYHARPVLQAQPRLSSRTRVPIVLSADRDSNNYEAANAMVGTCVTNPSARLTSLKVGESHFFVPPKSTFILSDIAEFVSHLQISARMLFCQAPTTLAPKFDLLVMDPPWSNRSVRRSRKYTTNEQQRGDEPFLQTLPIIQQSLHSDGLVAIWVTNKLAVRDQVTLSLEDLGFILRAEWTWVKITRHGEPVYDLNGLWRKPYERLLLFQRTPTSCLANKIIIAVPDLHSRKPCLRLLFERFMPPSYTALELFARYLVSGWWSWGDEVLKFQSVDHWEGHQQEESA